MMIRFEMEYDTAKEEYAFMCECGFEVRMAKKVDPFLESHLLTCPCTSRVTEPAVPYDSKVADKAMHDFVNAIRETNVFEMRGRIGRLLR